jgi:anionic cell wall polymer biosynthesis LytR-Cps2A-Psr (LCP) family protein
MVGGVTVTIEDDFSAEDETLKMGETITLNDEQAVHFVRGRMSVGDGTNENRMHRQKVYLEALQPLLMEKAESEKFVLNLYDALQDYMVTTLTGKDCSKMAKAVLKNESLGTLQIEGENSIDEYGFVQFIPDQDSLADVVIQLFYERLDERAGETNESNT